MVVVFFLVLLYSTRRPGIMVLLQYNTVYRYRVRTGYSTVATFYYFITRTGRLRVSGTVPAPVPGRRRRAAAPGRVAVLHPRNCVHLDLKIKQEARREAVANIIIQKTKSTRLLATALATAFLAIFFLFYIFPHSPAFIHYSIPTDMFRDS